MSTMEERRERWVGLAAELEDLSQSINIDPLVTLTVRLQAIEAHLFGAAPFDPKTDEHPMVHAPGPRLEYELGVMSRLVQMVKAAKPEAEAQARAAAARERLLGADGRPVGGNGFGGLAVPGQG